LVLVDVAGTVRPQSFDRDPNDELRVDERRNQRIVAYYRRRAVHPDPLRRFEVDEEHCNLRVVADVAHAEIHAIAVVAWEQKMSRIEEAEQALVAALVRAMRPAPRIDRRQQKEVARADERLILFGGMIAD